MCTHLKDFDNYIFMLSICTFKLFSANLTSKKVKKKKDFAATHQSAAAKKETSCWSFRSYFIHYGIHVLVCMSLQHRVLPGCSCARLLQPARRAEELLQRCCRWGRGSGCYGSWQSTGAKPPGWSWAARNSGKGEPVLPVETGVVCVVEQEWWVGGWGV